MEDDMKTLIAVLVAVTGAWSVAADPMQTPAEPSATTDQTSLIERFRYIETLDITAEKPMAPASQMEPVSAEIDDILAESQAAD
jgi:hypothetical protein